MDDKGYEEFVVVISDAVVDEDTVMIHFENASPAYGAVMRAIWFVGVA